MTSRPPRVVRLSVGASQEREGLQGKFNSLRQSVLGAVSCLLCQREGLLVRQLKLSMNGLHANRFFYEIIFDYIGVRVYFKHVYLYVLVVK